MSGLLYDNMRPLERDRSGLLGSIRLGHRWALSLLLILLCLSSAARAGKGPYDWALIRLDYARREKAEQLRILCDRLRALAGQAVEDQFVAACFDIHLQYAQVVRQGPAPESLVTRVQDLRNSFNEYYIQKYFAFYDILFVDSAGQVFYTIRQEGDLHANLLRHEDAPVALKRALEAKPPGEAFADFQCYGPSGKPAAFFVEPVFRNGAASGWIVLQCAISKINTLFAWADDLGQTGETFLINQEGYMLTESSFEGASTILKKRLDDRNVQTKFADGQGHRVVVDYRGCSALTSFEVVEFLGTKWLVVAKMDADEIVTEHYIQHRRYYADRLLAHLHDAPIAPLQDLAPSPARDTLRVDMDEFLWADHGERLFTFGISTCTGVLAAYPGKLAYLAHLSPKDKIYGAEETNLLGPMIKRIESVDIYRHERHRVVFVVVAPHLKTLLPIVDAMVDAGFFLSQVCVIYNPEAQSATVSYDCPDHDLIVAWRSCGSADGPNVHTLKNALNVGRIIERIMQREDEALPECEGAAGPRRGSSAHLAVQTN